MNRMLLAVEILVVIIGICGFVPSSASTSLEREKRSGYGVYTFTKHYVPNRDPQSFLNYGCFCGKGYRGSRPVDSIDRCCQAQDVCWKKNRCYVWLDPFITTYTWTCGTSGCRCTSGKRCRRNICNCDLVFAKCLKMNQRNFNKNFKGVRYTSKCR